MAVEILDLVEILHAADQTDIGLAQLGCTGEQGRDLAQARQFVDQQPCRVLGFAGVDGGGNGQFNNAGDQAADSGQVALAIGDEQRALAGTGHGLADPFADREGIDLLGVFGQVLEEAQGIEKAHADGIEALVVVDQRGGCRAPDEGLQDLGRGADQQVEEFPVAEQAILLLAGLGIAHADSGKERLGHAAPFGAVALAVADQALGQLVPIAAALDLVVRRPAGQEVVVHDVEAINVTGHAAEGGQEIMTCIDDDHVVAAGQELRHEAFEGLGLARSGAAFQLGVEGLGIQGGVGHPAQGDGLPDAAVGQPLRFALAGNIDEGHAAQVLLLQSRHPGHVGGDIAPATAGQDEQDPLGDEDGGADLEQKKDQAGIAFAGHAIGLPAPAGLVKDPDTGRPECPDEHQPRDELKGRLSGAEHVPCQVGIHQRQEQKSPDDDADQSADGTTTALS